MRERAKLKEEIGQLQDERVKVAQQHEQDLALLAERQRQLQSQIEVNHQNELKQIYQKSDDALSAKNKG